MPQDKILIALVLAVLLLSLLVLKLLKETEVLKMFVTDANTKLDAQAAAITALAAKIPTDDTVVTLADQAAILGRIDTNTAAVNAIQVPAPSAVPAG